MGLSRHPAGLGLLLLPPLLLPPRPPLLPAPPPPIMPAAPPLLHLPPSLLGPLPSRPSSCYFHSHTNQAGGHRTHDACMILSRPSSRPSSCHGCQAVPGGVGAGTPPIYLLIGLAFSRDPTPSSPRPLTHPSSWPLVILVVAPSYPSP